VSPDLGEPGLAADVETLSTLADEFVIVSSSRSYCFIAGIFILISFYMLTA